MKNHVLSALLATTCMALMGSPASAQRLVPPSDIPVVSQQAQAVQNYQVIELQEQVRSLNGKVEELNFLLLQMQEKLRKMEEDNEGRFQEIEDKLSDAGGNGSNKVAGVAKSKPQVGDPSLGKPEASAAPKASDVKPNQTVKPVETVQNGRGNTLANNKGEPPRALGTLTFDKDGNVVDGATGSVATAPVNPFGAGSEGSVEASEFGATPNEVFKVAQKAFDARDYPRAQQIFSAHIKAWPKDTKTGEARYWRAESLFWQKQYYEAAEAHLEVHNNFPEAPTAADNLLGLGLSLAGLNQREVACATYAEVLKQYPDAKRKLGKRVKDEQAATRC